METLKVLDIISKSKGYEYALMTTFDFDIGFFERFILNRLYDNGTKKVSVFVDSKEFVNSLNSAVNCSLGRKYVVHSVEMNGAFHPKLMLLLGQNKARLFVASANLTTNGYLRNNEIFNIFDFDSEHQENGKIIIAALDFFSRVNELSYKQDEALFNEIKQLQYYGKSVKNDDLFLLNNLDESIISQVKKLVPEVKSIDIAVPFYDNNLSAVESLKDAYPNAVINLFVQNRKSRFPIEKRSIKSITNLNIYNGFSDNNNAFYHGKVFRFETSDASYILYGSANCTQSAFVKSYAENANIECDVLEKGEVGEFNGFFNSFHCVYEKLQCEQITYKSSESNCFSFKYGVLKENLILYFGIQQDVIFTVHSNNEVLNAYKRDGMVIVELTIDQLPNTNVFDVTFKYGNTYETVKCWYVNPELLEFNRLNETADIIYSIDFDNNEDRYLEDKIAILRETALTPDEQQTEIDIINVVNATSSERATDEFAEDNEDGIVSYVIPDASAMQKYNKYKRINSVRLGYIDAFYHRITSGESPKVHAYKGTTSPSEPSVRIPISQEKRFVRFVNKRFKEFTNEEFTSLYKYNHYLSSILVFIDVFEKYINIDNNGLFNIEDIIFCKVRMLSMLLGKAIDEDIYPDEKEEYNTIVLTIQTILENHFVTEYPDAIKELENGYLLNWLNCLFNLRSSYERPTYAAVDLINGYYSERIDEDAAEKYIDNLFGYKEESALKGIICTDYGEHTDIIIDTDNKNISVTAAGDVLRNYMVLRPNTAAELKKFCRAYGIGGYTITVGIPLNSNTGQTRKGSAAAQSVTFNVSIGENRTEIMRTISRFNGNVDSPERMDEKGNVLR